MHLTRWELYIYLFPRCKYNQLWIKYGNNRWKQHILQLSNDFDSVMRCVVNILGPRFLDTSSEPELLWLRALHWDCRDFNPNQHFRLHPFNTHQFPSKQDPFNACGVPYRCSVFECDFARCREEDSEFVLGLVEFVADYVLWEESWW